MNINSNNLRIAKCTWILFTRIRFCFLFGLIVFSLSTTIYSDDKKKFTYYIEWANVAGAKGYLIQLKDKSLGTEKEEKLSQSNIELKLPAGFYEYRIASVNKFGKPSVWTAWEEFHVEKDKPKPGKKDAKQAEVKEPQPEPTPTTIKKWKWFIPGLTQYQSNQKLYASLWILWFTGLAVYGNSERLAGNSLAADKLNDPKYLSILALGGTPVTLDFYLWEKRSQAKAEYDQHQSNQAAAGAVAIISYALQVWHAKRVADKANVTVELNSRSQSFHETRGIQAGNPPLSFELKITMRY